MNPTQVTVTQTIAKAAAKTFLQAFLGVLVIALVPHLIGLGDAVTKGDAVVIDVNLYKNVLIAAVAGGVAALISMAWNWAKTPSA